MNDSLLDKPICLNLNSAWAALGYKTVRQAFTALCGGIDGGTPPALALDLTFDDDGKLVSAIPTKWEDWQKLPVRPSDLSITTKSGAIRVPMVIVSPVFSQMPVKSPQLTPEAIRRRDGNRCQVSNRILGPGEGNMGHIKARSKGGKFTWENIVLMDKKLNTLQGTKTVRQMGWKLAKKPRAPKPLPAIAAIREAKRPEHRPFIVS